jgi:hypothetical protein
LIFMFLVASSFDSLKCAVADFPHMKRFNVQSKNTECAPGRLADIMSFAVRQFYLCNKII